MSKKPLVLIIDAEIGAGKSTLLSVLEHKLEDVLASKLSALSGKNGPQGFRKKSICFIPEPVDIWKESGALEEYYNDIPGKAYKFQTFTFVTRVKRCLEYYHPDYDIYICERSIFSDKDIFVKMLAENGYFSDLDLTMYNQWWEMWSQVMPFKPSAFIYLDTPLEECIRRIKMRARGNEVEIDPEYHAALEKTHGEFLGEIANRGYPVYRLNGMLDFTKEEGQSEIVDRMANIIMEMLPEDDKIYSFHD